MPISKSIAKHLKNASWIRQMFEIGARMKRERGEENVFDFSLGNPDVEPPLAVLETLKKVADAQRSGSHGYMPNPGYPKVRERVAQMLRRQTGVAFAAEDVFMTVGAAGAANVLLKSILDPGDEVIVLNPFFPEYEFYISNHAGKMVVVETDDELLPDIAAIRAAITPRTRAIFVNTPNNPTGRVYPEERLRELDALVKSLDHSVIVISDEPYKSFVFDGKKQPEVASIVSNCAICTSWSKSAGLPGERIGFLALAPTLPDLADLRAACAFANRTLGYINAPAIWQWVMLECAEESVDATGYEQKRNLLCDALAKFGYEVRRPEGTFYVFCKTPTPDDLAFSKILAEEGVIAVPGRGFGRAGYMRLSLTIPLAKIEASLPAFERAIQRVRRG
jgi:aspartate aminotransferase